MIDEYITMLAYGYTSDKLTPYSNKKVCIICDKCGEFKVKKMLNITKKSEHTLCRSCSNHYNFLGKKHTQEFKDKTSKIHKGKVVSNETKEKISIGNTGKKRTDEIKKHFRLIRGGKNHPGYKGIHDNPVIKCDMCLNWFLVKNLATLSQKGNHFCSDECQNKYHGLHYNNENNPNYINGESRNPYPKEFNISLKRAVRELYNNCDFFSGLHKNIISLNRILSCHHIDYNKKNNDIHNLIPLSTSNHTKTNYNRFFWKKLIRNTQEIDKWYYKEGDYNRIT